MHSLYEAAQVDPSVPVHLLSDNSVMWLLQPVSDPLCGDGMGGCVQTHSAMFCNYVVGDSLSCLKYTHLAKFMAILASVTGYIVGMLHDGTA